MQVIWLNNKSRVSGDVHARFCESLKGKFLWATRLMILGNNPKELIRLKNEINLFLIQNLHLSLHPNKTILQRVNQGANFLGAIIFPHHSYPRERQIKSFRVKVNFFNKLLDPTNLVLKDIPTGGVWEKHINREKCVLSVEAIKRKILSTINSYYGLFIHSKSYTLRKKLFFSMGKLGDNIIPSNMNFTKFCCFKK